jgi:hypothetical protein
MSEQHPNPKNKIPGKHCGSRITHNERRTKHSQVCRQASAKERLVNQHEDPPNRAGRAKRRAAQRKKEE